MADRKPRLSVPPRLSEGDQIEYGVTQYLRDGGAEVWIKVGVVSTIRSGESVATAKKRVVSFVEDLADEKATEFMGEDE